MIPWLDDGDVRLFHGDALDVLRTLPGESVDCVVTSPPYWGLRDYGTGQWSGGDPACDHKHAAPSQEGDDGQRRSAEYLQAKGGNRHNRGGGGPVQHGGWEGRASRSDGSRVCRCGATRTDQQLGLEPTPDQFVQAMVAVFREIRRVLAPHGTVWCNLGDSYAAQGGGKAEGQYEEKRVDGATYQFPRTPPAGLKPKDLVGIPWRVAFALQQDGWYLRADVIWSKSNPMPESVTDRPTKAHEYVFLLTKAPRYWFDAEAVREPATEEGIARESRSRLTAYDVPGQTAQRREPSNGSWTTAGRNVRSVWNIATQPYPEAHFATFPEELARRCILAGCPTRVCRECGKPSERIVEETAEYAAWKQRESGWAKRSGDLELGRGTAGSGTNSATVPPKYDSLGWSDCGHNHWRPGVCIDPFIGSGTVAKVARDHARHTIGIDLSEEYLELAARRACKRQKKTLPSDLKPAADGTLNLFAEPA